MTEHMFVINPFSIKYNSEKYSSYNAFFEKHCLWYEKGELSNILSWLQDGMYDNKYRKSNLINMFALVNNMTNDFYVSCHQGGSSNSKRWSITKDLNRYLNKCIDEKFITWKEKTSLQYRLKEVHKHIGRGARFGRVTNDILCQYTLEQMLIDCCYYVGRHIYENEPIFATKVIEEKLAYF
jgi:hypothetical protein